MTWRLRRRASMRRRLLPVISVGCVVVLGVLVLGAAPASAGPCSPTTGASSCTVSASVTVTAGTLTVEAPQNLYWSFVGTGYDQWASGSAGALSGCTASGAVTTCSGGTAPKLVVLDASGTSSGWAVSAYLTSNTLPTGSALSFNGSGSGTIGNSQAAPIASSPFSGATPATVCDYASTCTPASAAASCAHSLLGFTTCPSYAMAFGGADSSHQVDLYSAAANSGLGAVCFASGTATATGCTGTTSSSFFNMGIKGNTAASTTGATINVVVSSGP